MNQLSYKHTYVKNLPHVQPPGAALFVTYRLAGSLPASVIQRLMEEADKIEKALLKIEDLKERTKQANLEQRRHFGKWDTALDAATTGPVWLKEPRIAQEVVGSLHYLDGDMYDLDTYCVMSNHVHVTFTPLEGEKDEYVALSHIMHSLKRHTALEANKILERRGKFWQHESYDHVVRDESENRIVSALLNERPAAPASPAAPATRAGQRHAPGRGRAIPASRHSR